MSKRTSVHLILAPPKRFFLRYKVVGKKMSTSQKELFIERNILFIHVLLFLIVNANVKTYQLSANTVPRKGKLKIQIDADMSPYLKSLY